MWLQKYLSFLILKYNHLTSIGYLIQNISLSVYCIDMHLEGFDSNRLNNFHIRVKVEIELTSENHFVFKMNERLFLSYSFFWIGCITAPVMNWISIEILIAILWLKIIYYIVSGSFSLTQNALIYFRNNCCGVTKCY